MDNSNSTPIIEFFAPSETSQRPWESTSPFFAPNYDLCPELIAIGQNQPFSIAKVLSFQICFMKPVLETLHVIVI